MREEEQDLTELPAELADLNDVSDDIKAHLPDLKCIVLLANPLGLQALIAIKAAKSAGKITSKEQCLRLADDAGQLGAVLGGAIAGKIAGATAECACKNVF